jgi:hypothetical protein
MASDLMDLRGMPALVTGRTSGIEGAPRRCIRLVWALVKVSGQDSERDEQVVRGIAVAGRSSRHPTYVKQTSECESARCGETAARGPFTWRSFR